MNTSITDLYIIGNGFDLHHGINSSYFEYRIWLKKHYEDIYWEIVNTFEVDDESEDYKIKLEERQHPWWKDFENNLGNISLSEIVDNCVFTNYPDFSSEEFRDRDYHAAEIAVELQLSKLVTDIKATFEEWVASLNTPDRSNKIFIGDTKTAFFITFNYTNTLETLYDIPSNSICYIHGKAENDEELIIGHNKSWEDLEEMADNTPEPPSDCITPEELEEWYCSQGDYITDLTRQTAIREYLSLQKNTSLIISEHEQLFESFSKVNTIHIYGLSLSDVDLPYIEHLITKVSPECKWEISYYNEAEKKYFIERIKILNIPLEKVSLVRLYDLKISNVLQYKLF